MEVTVQEEENTGRPIPGYSRFPENGERRSIISARERKEGGNPYLSKSNYALAGNPNGDMLKSGLEGGGGGSARNLSGDF